MSHTGELNLPYIRPIVLLKIAPQERTQAATEKPTESEYMKWDWTPVMEAFAEYENNIECQRDEIIEDAKAESDGDSMPPLTDSSQLVENDVDREDPRWTEAEKKINREAVALWARKLRVRMGFEDASDPEQPISLAPAHCTHRFYGLEKSASK
ncbi:hypothetical protein B0H10DRAFT_2234263 [Mycena sp. CBHHK59/15]|nr:hypothetical protein B0H10DRAFT_2234263 [Mycena sp. CBHHK59/15]